MASLVFSTVGGPWSADGETYVDTVDIEKPSRRLVKLASHAHAAGVINVTEGLDLSTVQSQEDGEHARTKAVANGKWEKGHLEQHLIELEQGVAPMGGGA